MFNYIKQKEALDKITNRLDDNELVCEQILKILGNGSTNIKIDNDIKNSYYVFLNDTIYLSNREKNRSSYQRICTIAHECIHSIQNKIMQVTNFILSNIELFSFIATVILLILKLNANIIVICYLIINVISIIPRFILEIDATIRSIGLSKKYMQEKISKEELVNIVCAYKAQITLMFPLFILSLFFGKFIRINIVYLLKYIMYI